MSDLVLDKGSVYIESQVLEVLERNITEHGSAKDFAVNHGLSQQFVSDVRKGRRSVTSALARRLGFKKEAIFIWEEPSPIQSPTERKND